MKRTLNGLAITGLLVVAGAGAAQAQTPVQFGVGGGVTIPLGTTSDALKTGWIGQALVQFKPAASPVGFQVDGNYQQLKFKDTTIFDKEETFFGTADAVYSFPVSGETKVRPYLIGGGGVYALKDKPTVSGGSSSTLTKFGINVGAGLDFAVSGATIFAEGRFHNVFISGGNEKFIPITVGVKFGGK